MKILLLVLLPLLLSEVEATSCPNTTATRKTKPLYLLTLVPFPDQKESLLWYGGLATIPGARVAQDEINNRTDLLPGYHIELLIDNIETCFQDGAFIGLSNFVKYTVNPPCRPVAAITGLFCSSHTSILSPVAGHDGFDFMQLSAANSPLFESKKGHFPHLWRFLGLATVYANTVLALMNQFKWQRVGVAYDTRSPFYFDIANDFEQKIRASANKTVVFSVGVSETKEIYFQHIITNLRNEGVTILIVLLNELQTSILLSRTLNEGLVYPDYTWVQIEILLQYLINEDTLDQDTLYKSTLGHIHLHTQTEPQNASVVLVSGETYTDFKKKYDQQLQIMKKNYPTVNLTSDVTFASYLYDQVWAFALALNNSLPELKNRNLSIDNYSIGQKEITAVIEEEMAKLSFQGAGGIVKFNPNRGVSTPAEVYWVTNNGTEKLVGIYNPLHAAHFSVHLNISDLPKDHPRRELVLIPLAGATLLYSITGTVIMFTTVLLSLLLYYRDHKAIKATSPKLSLLMFAGCYLLCISSTLTITCGSFRISALMFTIVINAIFILALNGLSLTLVTLCIKLLRVYRIFSLKSSKFLGGYWSNLSLILIAVFISVLPNIFIALLVGLDTPKYHLYTVINSFSVTEEHIRPKTSGNFIFISLIGAYFDVFLLLTIVLAVRTRKIKYKNFKDTKKVNLFVAVLTIILTLTVPIIIILFVRGNEPAANALMATALIAIPTASQVILFLPKVLPVVFEKRFSRIQSPLTFLLTNCTSLSNTRTSSLTPHT